LRQAGTDTHPQVNIGRRVRLAYGYRLRQRPRAAKLATVAGIICFLTACKNHSNYGNKENDFFHAGRFETVGRLSRSFDIDTDLLALKILPLITETWKVYYNINTSKIKKFSQTNNRPPAQ
jgi:hypothetical protein